MARTMDDLRDGGGSWGDEIRKYETDKRRVLDEGFLRSQQMRLTNGQMKSQERVFDPLLQRFRNNETEYKQRVQEETERINHLNRAYDIQVIREQPFHILRHESKFDAIAPGADPTRQPDRQRKPEGKGTVPDSQQDYNIISNLGYDAHHWARPDARPRVVEKNGKQRLVQSNRVRDFNIVTNHYHENHEGKLRKDRDYTLKEATHKYMKSNRFDPVTQQFNDPRNEETAKHCDDAREVEVCLRAEALLPPTYTGRPTQFYDPVSNKVHDPQMVKHMDKLENERKERYKNRYIVEHNFHAQDIKGDHLTQARKLNNVAPERFLEQERGYCILSNQAYGRTAKEKQIHAPYANPRKTPWEEIEHSHVLNGRSTSTPALPQASSEPVRAVKVASSVTPALSRSGSGGSQLRNASNPSPLREAGGQTLTSSSSTAQLRAPPGDTRPIVRTPSAPSLSLSAAPSMAISASAANDRTRRLTPHVPLAESMTMTTRAPAAPAIPGSPMGSVFSRPSAKV